MQASCRIPGIYADRIARGYVRERSPEVAVVPSYPNFFSTFAVTSHAGPWPYLQRVPVSFYGPGFIRQSGTATLPGMPTVADIAPTLAELTGTAWPEGRPGRSISQALVPPEERPGPLRMILNIVWDGGGWNVLDRWPKAWPTLARMMTNGFSIENAIVGSSPSVTPAIHSTMGTGAFPNQHGITDIPIRKAEHVGDSFSNSSPGNLELTTFADIYDLGTSNVAKVGLLAERGWHLGMLGHGKQIQDADRDIAVLSEQEEYDTNEKWYFLPSYLDDVTGLEKDIQTVDTSDGESDGTWMGHPMSNPKERRLTPAVTLFQTRLLKAIFNRQGFGNDDVTDVFYTNFKEVDLVGHVFNMLQPEMRSILKHTDDQLAALEKWLNEKVGRRRWVITFTADHGQGPAPRQFGAWPINIDEVVRDLGERFEVQWKDLVEAQRPTGFWLDKEFMSQEDITLSQVANFLVHYTLEDNQTNATTPTPEGYEDRTDEKLFAAAFPYNRIKDVQACTKS